MLYRIEKLAPSQIREIYTGPAVRHFPANERKPVAAIEKLLEDGMYIGLGMFEAGRSTAESEESPLMAYALFTKAADDYVLLDYYAVLEEYRSDGVGSIFIKEMDKHLEGVHGMLLETEDIDSAADEEEYNTRRRRNAFYSRNDVIMSDIMSEAAGVRYNIWYKPFTGDIPESDKLRNTLSDLYNVMFKRCEDADITWNIF